MKSSREGPSFKVSLKESLELDGVANVRAYRPTGSLLAARSEIGRNIVLDSSDEEAMVNVQEIANKLLGNGQ